MLNHSRKQGHLKLKNQQGLVFFCPVINAHNLKDICKDVGSNFVSEHKAKWIQGFICIKFVDHIERLKYDCPVLDGIFLRFLDHFGSQSSSLTGVFSGIDPCRSFQNCLMRSDPFSAIMMTAAFGFPLTISGMTEASMTRTLVRP